MYLMYLKGIGGVNVMGLTWYQYNIIITCSQYHFIIKITDK